MPQKANNLASNRNARRDFEFVEYYTAGIELRGNEIKSLRDGRAQIKEAYILVKDGEAWIHNLYIPKYKHAATIASEYDPYRPRKLLLNRRELERIDALRSRQGMTAVAINVFLSKNNLAKLYFGVGKGLRKHDKRENLKLKEARREIEKRMKNSAQPD